MRVARVTAHALTAPLDPDAQRTAFGPRREAALVLVEIETDDGVVGWGEALARYSLRSYVSLIEDLLAPLLVGQDPFEVERLWLAMARVFTGKQSGMLLEAVAACDIALWDVMGRATGRPIHHLLGSMGRRHVAAYASSISWGTDAIAVAQTERALAQGFRSIKVKLAGPVEAALARARLIRRTVGDAVELTADANWAFDFDDALRVGRGLAELGYAWFEEPLPAEDTEGYIRLRPLLPLRLAAGESEHTAMGCRTLLTGGGVGVIQPDPARSGGITETRRIASFAQVLGVPFAPHIGFSGAVCAAAALQLAAAAPNFLTYECMNFPNPLREALATIDVTDPARQADGALPVPEGPGLGIEVDRAALARFRAG